MYVTLIRTTTSQELDSHLQKELIVEIYCIHSTHCFFQPSYGEIIVGPDSKIVKR